MVLQHVLPGPQIRDLKGRIASIAIFAQRWCTITCGPQVRDLKGRELASSLHSSRTVVLQHGSLVARFETWCSNGVLPGLLVRGSSLKGTESQAAFILRSTVVLQCAPWSPCLRPQGERIASSLHSSRNGRAPSCAPWSPGSSPQASKGENRKLLAFFAQRWCSIRCSLVPRFETSRGESIAISLHSSRNGGAPSCAP